MSSAERFSDSLKGCACTLVQQTSSTCQVRRGWGGWGGGVWGMGSEALIQTKYYLK